MEQALAADNSPELELALDLAGGRYCNDDFTARIIAIASKTNIAVEWMDKSRAEAIGALAVNRTDAGVKALKELLNEDDIETSVQLAAAILSGYNTHDSPTGRNLLPGDFSVEDVKPMIERMLAFGRIGPTLWGLDLAALFGDDELTPRIIPLATDPAFRTRAIDALAMNRTDEGVKTLKLLLKDPEASWAAEAAIRRAYASRGNAHGRPLRPDDFDTKFQPRALTPEQRLMLTPEQMRQ